MNTRAPYPSLNPARAGREKPILSEIRMSRLRYPRATLFAMILLAVVFLLFGWVASAFEPSYTPAPTTFEGAAMIIVQWLVSV